MLMQLDQVRRRDETDGGFKESNAPMAFSVFQVRHTATASASSPSSLPPSKYFPYELNKVHWDSDYVGQRQKCRLFRLDANHTYIIVPSLFEKNVPMRFLIRIFTQRSCISPWHISHFAFVHTNIKQNIHDHLIWILVNFLFYLCYISYIWYYYFMMFFGTYFKYKNNF